MMESISQAICCNTMLMHEPDNDYSETICVCKLGVICTRMNPRKTRGLVATKAMPFSGHTAGDTCALAASNTPML